jgi:hypothetical protein
MGKQPKFFLKTRLRGIWLLLTKKHVVVLAANDDGAVSCRYNVTHASFQLMARVVDPVYENAEGEAAVLRQAKEILG